MLANAHIVTKVFLLFLALSKLIESYLDKRNKNHILANRNTVPAAFADKITLEDHQKAADYSISKINTSQFFGLIDTVVLLSWTVLGGIELLNRFVVDLGYSQSVSGVIFFGLFGVISFFINLPQSIYTTFVIEEKFGFNKTTPKLFILDVIKGIVLGALIGGPLLYGLLIIMEKMGDFWWVYGWAFLTVFQLVLVWAYPTFIAPLFNKFSEMEEGEVKEKVLGLLQRTGFTSNGLFVMDASIRSSHGNAYFTGFGKSKRIVFFDTLIKTLEPEEVEAVLAHELGHFKRKHIIKGMVKSIVLSFIGFFVLGYLMKSETFFIGHGLNVSSMTTYTGLCLFTLVSGVYTFFITPLNAMTSRKWEFEADSFASEYAQASKLISALVKLYKDNASTLTPDPLYSAYYHSHPPALIRVEHLEKLQKS